MITKEELDNITNWLKWNIFRNSDIMYAEDPNTEEGDRYYDLIDMIASLHNLLHIVIGSKGECEYFEDELPL